MFIDTCKIIEIVLSDKETEALKTTIEVLQNIQMGVFCEDEEFMESGENKLTHEDFEFALDTLNLIKEEK